MALAPALRVLTWPLLVLTILLLGRGWRLELSGNQGGPPVWRRMPGLVLIGSTLLAGTIWGLRFAGLLGMPIL